MSEFVQKALAELKQERKHLTDRITQLESELHSLDQAEEALRRIGSGAIAGAEDAARRGGRAVRGAGRQAASAGRQRRPSGRRGGHRSTGKRGRPPGSGKRQVQAIKLVTANPGISPKALGDLMGMEPTYLYRLLPDLERAGVLKKVGKGWYAADAKVPGKSGSTDS